MHSKSSSSLAHIRSAATPAIDLLRLHELSRKLGELPKQGGLPKIKIALGGNATLDYVRDGLEFHLRLLDIDAQIQLLEFGTLEAQAFDPASPLYRFAPDLIWHFSTSHDFKANAEEEVSRLAALWRALQKNSGALILQNNFDLPALRIYGDLEAERGKGAALRHANERLLREKPVGVTIFDYDWLSCFYGKREWCAARFWHMGRYPFAVDATSLVAHGASRVIAGLLGHSKKCLALDLDNTLWGGVAGEEEIQLSPGDPVGEAFREFQKYVLGLKERGVILALVSKNDEAVARRAFENANMLLKWSDFAATAVNWNSKAANLRELASQCGIRTDSIVFVDDNPAERELVRSLFPEIAVPDLPSDPSLYSSTLDEARFFEPAAYTPEDARRSQLYDENRRRIQLSTELPSHEEFLKNLQMRIETRNLSEDTLQRAAQLINKTNQFNLTGEKVRETELQSRMRDGSAGCRVYRLVDKFGDNGWISVVAFRAENDELHLTHWVMSCRVLMREVETFVHHDLVKIASSRGIRKIVGHWRATGRNELVRGHFERLGYRLKEGTERMSTWEFEVTSLPAPGVIAPIAD